MGGQGAQGGEERERGRWAIELREPQELHSALAKPAKGSGEGRLGGRGRVAAGMMRVLMMMVYVRVMLMMMMIIMMTWMTRTPGWRKLCEGEGETVQGGADGVEWKE